MTKRCSICKKLKDKSEFYRQSKPKKTLRSECKKCAKEASTRYYQRNKVKILAAAQKRYRQKRKLARKSL